MPNENSRGRMTLPRNWRILTVAGVTSIGLACGATDTVMGDWWPLSKSKSEPPKAAAAPAATENGFASTIRRLMADAKKYAEKGELDKAVQLAERAAKISEASEQLLGPSSDCSPEETAKLAKQLRSQRDGVAVRSVPSPAAPTVAPIPKPAPVQRQPVEVVERPAQPAPRVQPPVKQQVVAETEPVFEMPVETAAPQRAEPRPRTESSAREFASGRAASHSESTPRTEVASREAASPWDDDLPPTPAPEAEPTHKPVKFRRGPLARAGHSTDETDFESRTTTDESAALASSGRAIIEALETDFDDEPSFTESPAVPTKPVVTTRLTKRDAELQRIEQELPAPKQEITSVPPEASPDSSVSEPGPDAVQATLAERSFTEPPAKNDSVQPDSRQESVAEVQPPAAAATAEASVLEQPFPVQRVVQLRRRLQTAAAFDPGVAYSSPPPASASAEKASSSTRPAWEESATVEETAQAQPAEEQTSATAHASSEHPKHFRLREHRVGGLSLRPVSSTAALQPPAPTGRKHAVGHSEPMLWQSSPDGVTQAASTSADTEIGPDLRDPSSHGHRAEVALTGTIQPIQMASLTQDLPRAEPDSLVATNVTPVSGPPLAGASVEDSQPQPGSNHDHDSAETESTTNGNRTSLHSFAFLERLSTALKLPINTTASLLGGTGLALLGVGLLLLRAAIRWRHS